MAELHVIPTAKTLKVGAHKRRSPSPAERPSPFSRWPAWVAVGAVSVGGLLLVLSLQHLAVGVMAITGCGWWEGILLAIGIDLGLVVTECAAIVASPAVAKLIRFYVWAMITSTPGAERRIEQLGVCSALRGTDGLRQLRFRLLRALDGL